SPSTQRKFPRPAVIVNLSPFGDQLHRHLIQHLEVWFGQVPSQYQALASAADLTAQVGPALTRVLNVRSVPAGQPMLLSEVQYQAPLVLLVASAAELAHVEQIQVLEEV